MLFIGGQPHGFVRPPKGDETVRVYVPAILLPVVPGGAPPTHMLANQGGPHPQYGPKPRPDQTRPFHANGWCHAGHRTQNL